MQIVSRPGLAAPSSCGGCFDGAAYDRFVPSSSEQIVGLLVTASRTRTRAVNVEPWNYGWSQEKYRRSTDAAIASHGGAIRLSSAGVEAFEVAVKKLLAMPQIRRGWKGEEVWEMVADLVAALPDGDDAAREVASRAVAKLSSPGPTLVAFAVANTRWSRDPLKLANTIVGTAGSVLAQQVRPSESGRAEVFDRWMSDIEREDANAVVVAATVPAQGERATAVAIEQFDAIVAFAILFELDPEGRGLFSGRGDSHRPRVRGLTVDRQALSQAAPTSSLQLDLAANIFTSGPLIGGSSLHWWGDDAFPLDDLLDECRCEIIAKLLGNDSTVYRRFVVAARWYAKAHWSHEPDDAILACGIALDALLAERGGSPGRVIAERFALLEREVSQRPDRLRRMNEVYAVRSASAHGGRARELDQPLYTRGANADVRWCAKQMWELAQHTQLLTEDDHRKAFDDLKWGTLPDWTR
jgi:hypothetical protein